MKSSTIISISASLTEDGHIIKHILKFADFLGIKNSEREQLEREIQSGNANYYNWLKKILESWVAKNGRAASFMELENVLTKIQCVAAAERIHEMSVDYDASLHSDVLAARKPVDFKVTRPISSFVGRSKELQKLTAFLRNEERRLLVISGFAGEGKTQLCRRWLQEVQMSPNPTLIICLTGGSGQALTSSLMQFASSFGTPITDKNFKDFKEILNHLETLFDEQNILWIVDNVDTIYEEIKLFCKFVVNATFSAKAVLTSRLKTIFPEIAHYITLSPLSEDAGHQLVRKIIQEDMKNEDVVMLCEATGYHALAIQLSTGFIRAKQISSSKGYKFGVHDFLNMFRDDKQILLGKVETLSEYENTVIKNVTISIQLAIQINGECEDLVKSVMIVLSLLCHDGVDFNFIQSLLAHFLPSFTTEQNKRLEKALESLKSVSLLESEDCVITTHPLVQEAVRVLYPEEWKMAADSIFQNMEIQGLALRNLQHILKSWEIIRQENEQLLRKHFPSVEFMYFGLQNNSQLQSLLPFAERQWKKALRVFDFDSDSYNKGCLVVQRMFGKALLENGKADEALSIFDELVQISTKHYSNLDKLTLDLENDKASALHYLGRTEEAVKIYEELLPRSFKVYGEGHPQPIVTKNNLAFSLTKHNRVEEALKIHHEVLTWRLEHLGQKHPQTLTTKHNIGHCHLKKDNFMEAKAGFESVVDLRKEVLGEKHYSTLSSKALLAQTLLEIGEHLKALVIYEDLVKVGKEIMGPEHMDTLMDRYNYATTLVHLEEYHKAEEEFEEILKIKIKIFGIDHSEVKVIKDRLHEIQTLPDYEGKN